MKKKYKFYKNKRTRNHPSIELFATEKIWNNLEVTSNPTETGRYIKLKHPVSKNIKQSYVRKYVRKDPIRTRGNLLSNYELSDEDMKQIENYLDQHFNKKS